MLQCIHDNSARRVLPASPPSLPTALPEPRPSKRRATETSREGLLKPSSPNDLGLFLLLAHPRPLRHPRLHNQSNSPTLFLADARYSPSLSTASPATHPRVTIARGSRKSCPAAEMRFAQPSHLQISIGKEGPLKARCSHHQQLRFIAHSLLLLPAATSSACVEAFSLLGRLPRSTKDLLSGTNLGRWKRMVNHG